MEKKIVGVKFMENTGNYSEKEYAYFTRENFEIGD